MTIGPELDYVARYAKSIGLEIGPRTVLVEGTTDVALFELASNLEKKRANVDLLAGLTIVAAGKGDSGGASGVARELLTLRGVARPARLQGGKAAYRFLGLFDNDKAGRYAIKGLREMDTSIDEYRDVFRIAPVMPMPGNLDASTVRAAFEKANEPFIGIDWEIEDCVSEVFFEILESEYPRSVVRRSEKSSKVHRDLSRDGKARFHRLVQKHAICDDLKDVIATLKSLRVLMGLPKIDI